MFRPAIQKLRILILMSIFCVIMAFISIFFKTTEYKNGYSYKVEAREVMSAAGDESIVGDDPSGADDTGGKLSNEQIATKLKRVQELLAKATPQETDESFVTRTYAEQLLEAMSDRLAA